MFKLEQSIAEWRQQVVANGIKTPEVLNELESHLRDEIEQLTKSGLIEQKAFEISVQRIGQPKILQREFKKSERTFMKRTMIISAAIFAVLIGTAIILPALAKHNEQGAWTGEHFKAFLLGVAIAVGGLSTAIYSFKKRKA